ncbi:MAG TPA: hypothetical protein VG759_23685 [Candidatus Angelobacter sp.]|nr:hypothetical protein [Candidatus Angelobacter sp.]
MIVLLDSGIWISGLQFDGIPLKALEKALVEDEIAICDQIEEEIARVLTEKFGWHVRYVMQSLAIYTHKQSRFQRLAGSKVCAAMPRMT